MQFPDDPALAGQTVDCDVRLDLQYPHLTEPGHFQTMTDSMFAALDPAPRPGRPEPAEYDQLWWGCGIAGILLILGAELLLIQAAKSLKATATPTRILAPAPAA